ncbi:hypothetical protein IFR05_006957 [Cadophora sp. M221]|nr:hypothetical protein IFR05_006957 [Cadophora sp. M221]
MAGENNPQGVFIADEEHLFAPISTSPHVTSCYINPTHQILASQPLSDEPISRPSICAIKSSRSSSVDTTANRKSYDAKNLLANVKRHVAEQQKENEMRRLKLRKRLMKDTGLDSTRMEMGENWTIWKTSGQVDGFCNDKAVGCFLGTWDRGIGSRELDLMF